ncbi:MAG: V-type ATP synthase subunit F [Candidatus Methanoperedenaceae archaeon]|nr:V-type ATP synthase subunit F [Candidatus Methanoperedenaceae archaeon]
MEIAVVGSSDFVIGFRLAGVRKIFETNHDDIEEKIKGIMEDRTVAILVLHQDDVGRLPDHLQKTLDDSVEPTIISIGGKGESSNLREKIKQSVGVDLWK